eukprot:7020756-Karenia_brevis.AAC.1
MCIRDREWRYFKVGEVGPPWKRYEGDEEEDGEVFEGVTDEERKGEQEKPREKEGDGEGQEKVV